MSFFTVAENKSYLSLAFHAPAAGNAFGLAVATELSRLRKDFRQWRKPVVVRSSHPRLFCSGGNLSDYQKLKSKAAGLAVNREITRQLKAFGDWPVLKLAIVEGDCLGGGMEWLGYFDFRWSAPHSLFCFWQKRIGLSTGWGGGKVWAKRLGEARVRQLLLESRLFGAQEALRLGVVDRVYSSWKINPCLEEWVLLAPHPKLLSWSSAREEKIFAALWLGPEHKANLARWRR